MDQPTYYKTPSLGIDISPVAAKLLTADIRKAVEASVFADHIHWGIFEGAGEYRLLFPEAAADWDYDDQLLTYGFALVGDDAPLLEDDLYSPHYRCQAEDVFLIFADDIATGEFNPDTPWGQFQQSLLDLFDSAFTRLEL